MIRDGEHFCACTEGDCPTPPEYEFDWNYSVIVGFPCLAEATDFATEVQGGNLAGYTTFSCSDVHNEIPTVGAIEMAQEILNLHRSKGGEGMYPASCGTCETQWPCPTVQAISWWLAGPPEADET